MGTCRVCGTDLTTDSWSEGMRKAHNPLCKVCHVEERKEYKKKHPEEKPTKEYMRKYMKKYRQQNLKRMQELGRLEYHRRSRELPTDTILNEHFEGADLHHMTPSVGVYIPKTLHRSVYHNLKTREGMEKINAKAMDWLQRV